MGFFNWFSAKSAAKTGPASHSDIHATLVDKTRPFVAPNKISPNEAPLNPAQRLEQRRTERNARRELLFQVVRESMVRAGVLSSAFKFKVLALDQRGKTFLVMIDLSAEFAGETDKLSEIEALISQTGKNRFDLIVQAVYWRFYDSVVSNSVTRANGAASAPAPLFGLPPQRPAPAAAQARPLAAPTPTTSPVASIVPTRVIPSAQPALRPATSSAYNPSANLAARSSGTDPLEQDEVAAFKRALASGAQPGLAIPLGGGNAIAPQPRPAAPAAAPAVAQTAAAKAAPLPHPATLAAAAAAKAASMAAINNKLLLTGYEDTEMPDPDEPAPVLSTTQYGELR
jgi:hypothetical protein